MVPTSVICSLILFSAVFVFGLYALVRGLRLGKRTGGMESDAGYCGHCHYDVRGVTSFECPECGSDLRKVGIVRNVKKKGMTWMILGVISLFLMIGMMLMLMALLWVSDGPQPAPKVPAVQITPGATTAIPPRNLGIPEPPESPE